MIRFQKQKLLYIAVFCLLLFLMGINTTHFYQKFFPYISKINDFAHYYIATRIFIENGNPYKEDLGLQYKKYGFLLSHEAKESGTIAPNPPTFFYLFLPFAIFDSHIASTGWFIFQLACLFYILFLTKWLFKDFFLNFDWFFFCFIVASSSWLYSHLRHSQLGLLLTALIFTAFALKRTDHHISSCLLIATAGMIKLFPFILLPWFVYKRDMRIQSVIKIIIITFGYSALIFFLTGYDNWIQYYTYSLSSLPSVSFGLYGNYSLPSCIGNFILAAYPDHITPSVSQNVMNFSHLAGLLLLTICYVIALRGMNSPEVELSFLIVAMLICQNRTLGHYFVLLIFPIATAWGICLKKRSVSYYIVFFIFYLFINQLHLHSSKRFLQLLPPSIFFRLFLNYIPLLGLFSLMVILLLYSKTMIFRNSAGASNQLGLEI